MKLIYTSLPILIAVYCFFFTPTSYAVDGLSIQIGSINLDALDAETVNVDFGLSSSGLTVTSTITQLTLPKPINHIKNVRLTCTALKLFSEQVQCNQGQLSFQHQQLGAQKLGFAITALPDYQHYQIAITGIKLADATIQADVLLKQQKWQLSAKTPDINLSKVLQQLQPYLTEQQQTQLQQWEVESSGSLNVKANGNVDALEKATVQLNLTDFALSEQTGLYVAEAVNTELQAVITQNNQRLNWQAELMINNGQAYAEPVFLDFQETPVTITSLGRFNTESQLIELEQLTLTQSDVLSASANYVGDVSFNGKFELSIAKTELSLLYQHWLQPFLIDSASADVELAGRLSLQLQKEHDTFSVKTVLEDIYIDDQQNRFGLYALDGTVGWTNTEQLLNTDLSWQGGYLYQLPLGESHLKGEVKNETFTLSDTWQLPVLDGQLSVNDFELHRPQQGEMQWSFGGQLSPISMTALTSAFGWPTMYGKLSGEIPQVGYTNQTVEISGALKVNLFGGQTVINDLRLAQPFGSLPQLYANVELKSIDLETLTSTFDFGKITGKLDGEINQLRLANWQPVAFDARFYTPEGDESRKRISQQAVNNLSEVSGGASALLSRSFLRFFENFSYKQLGLSCKLVNDVCEMNGIKSAENGYFLVEGGGLPPQINVMGFTRRVNWPELLARLKAVSNADGVVVE